MASTPRTFESVKEMCASFHGATTSGDTLDIYNTWAENYDQDLDILGYDGAGHVAKILSSHFSGDRGAAVVLDVACGTGLVAKTNNTKLDVWIRDDIYVDGSVGQEMKQIGFGKFVGIDGSKLMLEEAQKKGLYQDLKLCVLGEQPLPVQKDAFDVVVICGALALELVPSRVVRELCVACKPGGLVCMTCRHSPDNLEYKAALESELKQMQDKGLWTCVDATEVENWVRGVSAEQGDDYSSAYVYLYKKL